ncbi:glutaminyl-peptide cyclotransferase [Sphingobacterium yanglingense]|uniref:Glutamine cyclotransferase n=1 Tax=Sphingobacterium yanglingense TaxID=1437280 RepID=A0A4R6WIQ2_9SPHI|nr:glutaminyl-peptide cyclotransferase [Sphingobacterium yanglingense]TDQ77834.1 glutamine cyclotransferase [Sphingobacterium yanglingense]
MYARNFMGCALLVLSLGACNSGTKEGQKSNAPVETQDSTYSIVSEGFKVKYNPGDTLSLTVKGPEGANIDSVLYAIDGDVIGRVNGNEELNYDFGKSKFGIKVVKATIYVNTGTEEANVRVDYLPAMEPKLRNYELVNTYPHDIEAYTQGLEFYGDKLLESTGNGAGRSGKKGKSSVRIVDLKTGKVERMITLDDNIFGEGTTILNSELYQLTYKNNEAYVYDISTLEKKKTLPYFKPMEGWGLTNNGKDLFMSDGSEKIYVLNAGDFKPKDIIQVVTSEGPVPTINELEWVNGKIFANFYQEDLIGIINPVTGVVEGLIDLSKLKTMVTQHVDLDVLNGIAYNKKTNTFFVTGKNWDKMFEIKID